MTIYLDVDPIVGLKRAKKVGDPDRIEQAGLEFFHRTRKVFKDLVAKTDNAYEIDSSLPVIEIERQIHSLLKRYFLVFLILLFLVNSLIKILFK